ncbi:hypothetical protein IscW_ISCW024296, partial [Ixodes scapularis]
GQAPGGGGGPQMFGYGGGGMLQAGLAGGQRGGGNGGQAAGKRCWVLATRAGGHGCGLLPSVPACLAGARGRLPPWSSWPSPRSLRLRRTWRSCSSSEKSTHSGGGSLLFSHEASEPRSLRTSDSSTYRGRDTGPKTSKIWPSGAPPDTNSTESRSSTG